MVNVKYKILFVLPNRSFKQHFTIVLFAINSLQGKYIILELAHCNAFSFFLFFFSLCFAVDRMARLHNTWLASIEAHPATHISNSNSFFHCCMLSKKRNDCVDGFLRKMDIGAGAFGRWRMGRAVFFLFTSRTRPSRWPLKDVVHRKWQTFSGWKLIGLNMKRGAANCNVYWLSTFIVQQIRCKLLDLNWLILFVDGSSRYHIVQTKPRQLHFYRTDINSN